ncbi:MAG: type II toxin-antitoxin system VapC family toxin [Pseudomonadota bacterium]
MYLFDSNIFLEILLGQSSAHQARDVLEKMTEKQRGCVTSFSLHAIEAIIGAKQSRLGILADFLSFVISHPFLDPYYTTSEEELEVAKLAKRLKLDFDDALQYFVAKKEKYTLVTFDRDFLKVKGIKVLFPG